MSKKYNDFDPWEHFEEEDEGGFVKIKAPKIKKVKKESDFNTKKRKNKRN